MFGIGNIGNSEFGTLEIRNSEFGVRNGGENCRQFFRYFMFSRERGERVVGFFAAAQNDKCCAQNDNANRFRVFRVVCG